MVRRSGVVVWTQEQTQALVRKTEVTARRMKGIDGFRTTNNTNT